MNSLSLRVSSIKNSENLKKNSEIRVALLDLPPKYAESESQQGEPNNANDDEFDMAKFKKDFLGATSIDQQLVVVRKCFTSISPDISTDELTTLLQLLTDMFFFAPLKHPVRNAISKLLQKSQVLHGLVIKCLANTIEEQTNHLVSIDDPEHQHHLNSILTSLGGCFENFPVALTAVKICIQRIFKYIAHATEIYLENLGQPLSPAKRSEIYIFIHTSIRLSIAVIQQCYEQTSVDTIEQYLGSISQTCFVLIDDSDVPMDTKVNCGQFLLLCAKLLDTIDLTYNDIMCDKFHSKPIQKLIVSVGFINTLSESHLEDHGFVVLRKVSKNLTDIASENSIEQSTLIAASRGLVQLSKNLVLFKLNFPIEEDNLAHLTQVLDDCLSFVWTFAEHYMDSVRHLSKDILKNLLKLTQKHPTRFQCVTDKVLEVAQNPSLTNDNIQCLALDHLCQILGAKPIIDAIPFINLLLMSHLTEQNWASCYDKIMISDSKDTAVRDWYRKWVQPTLVHLRRNDGNEKSLNIYENLLSSAITTRSEVVELIIAEKRELPIEAYLFVLWTIRKNAIPVKLNSAPALDPIVIDAKFHGTDEVRIMPLRILIEVGKSTEVFSNEELNEILAFLYYNCNCQSPSMRSQIGSYMTRAFLRLDASHAVSLRSPDSSTPKDYVRFLSKLRDLCISNLFDGSNFSRRSISLNLLLPTLRLLMKIIPSDTDITLVWNQALYEVLYETVESDTYETNKSLAIEIVQICPADVRKMYHEQYIQEMVPNLEEKIRDMLTSVRPGISQAGAYLIEYLRFSGQMPTTLEIVEWCERHILEGFAIAKQSVLKAARLNPLYGLVFCIKRLMSTVDYKTVKNEEWRPFIKRFICTCKDLLEVVAPIVNSDSPEGHLPNDFGEVNDSIHKTTSQMVLLCAWRTVKEISLLLGELTLHAPITYPRNPQNGLLTVDQILDIGITFQVMLAEIKHRGAFEQAYVGFSKLCIRMWRSSEPELHNCPMTWLVGLIDLISGNEKRSDSTGATPLKYERICATRRSAGVPFMIQALITSELQVCSSTGLHYCMRQLFVMCRSEENEESRTHALNILRALFRCTDLGDAVSEYISDGLECSITGYTAKTWPERNSATLLFAALITRVFGVQKTRHSETLNIRNKMTGRIFFLRYPRLFDFISNQLVSATNAISASERPMNLHPLLLLLSRLYPSSLEGCESSMHLSSFLPHIMRCSVCPEMETRKLAVKSLVALISPNNVLKHLQEVLELIKEPTCNSNAKHGYLLQLQLLIKSLDKNKLPCNTESTLQIMFADLLDLHLLEPTKPNHIIGRVYMDILSEIIIKLNGELRVPFSEDILLQINHIQKDRRTIPIYFIGRPEACRSSVILQVLLEIAFNQYQSHSDFELHSITDNLDKHSHEHIETILNILLLLTDNSNGNLPFELVDEYEFSDSEMDVAGLLTAEQKSQICDRLKTNQRFKQELFAMTQNIAFDAGHTVKIFTILSRLDVLISSEIEIRELLALCTNQPDEYTNGVLKLLGAHLRAASNITNIDGTLLRDILHMLREASDTNCIDNLRISAVIGACSIPNAWWEQTYPSKHILEYSILLFAFLRDDHYLVREHAVRKVMDLVDSLHTQTLPISIRAEEVYIDWLDQMLLSNAVDAKSIPNFWLELLDRLMESDTTDSDALEVFNKNEANLFGEQIHTAQLVYKQVMKHIEFKQSICIRPFDCDRLFFIHDCFL